ncbi:MAG: hypothetical protein V3T64_12520 [Myxococcota bacterium]
MALERSGPRHAPSIAMALFCAFTVVFLASRDLFLPEVRDREIWFGFELRGTAAVWTAPLHWALFSVACWAFWKNMRWIWPAATSYACYVALSHLGWNLSSPSGGGWSAGLQQLGLFLVPAILIWKLRPQSRSRPPAA